MYVGGGTTTIIEEELIKTLEHARKLFPSIKEISCETDPQIITTPQFRNLKGLVDRMSIGVQSFNDDLLKLSERYEKFGSGEQIFERLQYAQELFPTCNIDMMFGFRGQTLDHAARRHGEDLEAQSASGHDLPAHGHVPDPQEREERHRRQRQPACPDQYRVILDTLGSRYNHLTSWTFGRTHDEGFDDTWSTMTSTSGVGSGAFSSQRQPLRQYVQPAPLQRANRRRQHGVDAAASSNKHAILQYRLMLGLFSHRLSRKYFREVHGVNLDRTLMKEMLARAWRAPSRTTRTIRTTSS